MTRVSRILYIIRGSKNSLSYPPVLCAPLSEALVISLRCITVAAWMQISESNHSKCMSQAAELFLDRISTYQAVAAIFVVPFR